MIGQVAALRAATCTVGRAPPRGQRGRRRRRWRRPRPGSAPPARPGPERQRRDRRGRAQRAVPGRRRHRRSSGRTSSAARTRSARSRPSAGTRPSSTTRRRPAPAPARRPRASGAASSTTSASIRCATASRPGRWRRSSRSSCSASRSRAGPSPTPATRPRPPTAAPAASSTASGPASSSAPRPAPTCRAPTASAPSTRTTSAPLPAGLDDALPALTEDSFPGVLSNVIAGRIANRLDLGGVNYTVDAACASSLAAVDLAVKELVLGTSDVVLCGGADLHNSINDYLLFASVHALSPTGQCHTFDAAADGIVLGEGVACVVLKRLADAERDGDRIYAVIRGVAGASDGKSLGLTAPRKEGQVRALERAYRQAGVSPAEVGLVEAHGTGTVVGDRTELATLTDVFGAAGAAPGALRAGLGQVADRPHQVRRRPGRADQGDPRGPPRRPAADPQRRVAQPVLAARRQPVHVPRPGPAVAGRAPGRGGQRVRLRRHQLPRRGRVARRRRRRPGWRAWPAELLLFRGETPADAVAAVERVRARGSRATSRRGCATWRARSCAGRRRPGPGRDGRRRPRRPRGQARGRARRCAAIRAACSSPAPPPVERQARGSCPRARAASGPGCWPSCSSRSRGCAGCSTLGRRWADRCCRRRRSAREEKAAQAAALTDTRVAQPALGVADLAMAELLGALGVRPDMVGRPQLRRAGRAVRRRRDRRGRPAGAVGGPRREHPGRGRRRPRRDGRGPRRRRRRSRRCSTATPASIIANHNSPQPVRAVGADRRRRRGGRARSAAAGIAAKRIPVACAFHSPIVAGAQGRAGRAAGGDRGRGAARPGVVERDRRALPGRARSGPRAARRSGRAAGPLRRGDRGDVRGRRADLRRGRPRSGHDPAGRRDPGRPTPRRGRLRRRRRRRPAPAAQGRRSARGRRASRSTPARCSGIATPG